MATCMRKIGTWESCLQLHTAMNLDIRVTDPTACHRGLFSWMTRPSVSSWGVAHHLIIIMLHWEQCHHLLRCGASHKSGHCKRHRKVNVLVQKWCIWLLTQDLKSSSGFTCCSCQDANPMHHPVETQGLAYLEGVYYFSNKNSNLLGWLVQSNPHHLPEIISAA